VPEDQANAFSLKQLKLLAEKVKDFVPKVKKISNEIEKSVNSQEEEENVKKTVPERAIVRSVSQLIAACNNDENCSEEVQEKLEINGDDEQSKPLEVNRNVKRVLENMESTVAKKKMKHYESPLEFLKLPDISNRKYDISLNLKYLINLSFSIFLYDLTSKNI
jgi:hypothetical protein